MKCEFDNTDIEGTPSVECRHVSGVRTHRSVKWCLNRLNYQFWSRSSPNTAGIPVIVYSFTASINKLKF